MNSYIMIDWNGRISSKIQSDIASVLRRYEPRGCPFKDYTALDLLTDWVQMYSWQLDRNRKYSLPEFVNAIYGDAKVELYKDAILGLIEEVA